MKAIEPKYLEAVLFVAAKPVPLDVLKEVFQVDEAGYAAIVKQVRDKEFNKELKEREAQFKIAKEDALEVAKTKAEKDLNQLIAQKDKEIADLQKKHDSEFNETKLEIANLNAQIAAAESEKNTELEKAEAQRRIDEEREKWNQTDISVRLFKILRTVSTILQ